MKATTVITIMSLGLTVMLLSCGPSEETIKQKTKQNMETKLALQDSIKIVKDRKTQYENVLSDAKGELEVAKDKLSRIKEWQFGRSNSEREEQIRNQTKVIDELEKYIEGLKKAIPQIEEEIDLFEMQLQFVEADLNK